MAALRLDTIDLTSAEERPGVAATVVRPAQRTSSTQAPMCLCALDGSTVGLTQCCAPMLPDSMLKAMTMLLDGGVACLRALLPAGKLCTASDHEMVSFMQNVLRAAHSGPPCAVAAAMVELAAHGVGGVDPVREVPEEIMDLAVGGFRSLFTNSVSDRSVEGISEVNTLCETSLITLVQAGIRRYLKLNKEQLVRCSVCFDDVRPGNGWVTLACGHAFCQECLFQTARVAVNDNGLLPVCPMSASGCEHLISEGELSEVLVKRSMAHHSKSAGSQPDPSAQVSLCSLSGAWAWWVARAPVASNASWMQFAELRKLRNAAARLRGRTSLQDDNTTQEDPSQASVEEQTMQRFQLLQQLAGLRAIGAFPCVACAEWMVPQVIGIAESVQCPSCKESFCSKCFRRPPHYNFACHELPQIYEKWQQWLNSQGVVLQELQDRMQEDELMESWKETHCRLCPSCNRAIERVSGCTSMICGKNAHGGNVQSGCGASFDWRSAKPYRRQGVQHLEKLRERAIEIPKGAKEARWPISSDLSLGFEHCDACAKDIVGPKFTCVDCPSLVVCVKCVAQSLEHPPVNAQDRKRWRSWLPWGGSGLQDFPSATSSSSSSSGDRSLASVLGSKGHKREHIFHINWNAQVEHALGQQRGKKRCRE